MKEFSNKKPYLSPQLTVVEFRMEVGYGESQIPEVSLGVKGLEDSGMMYFLGQQGYGVDPGHSGSYMGSSRMGYFGNGFEQVGGEGTGYF